MSIALGIRAEADGFCWAVVEGSSTKPVLSAVDHALFPVAYSEPEALSWCRNRFCHLVDLYKAERAAVRYPEFRRFPPTESDRKRLRVEGVLIEAAHSKGLTVLTGALATISKNLGVGSAKMAKSLLSGETFRDLDLRKHNEKAREAIFVAVSGLR